MGIQQQQNDLTVLKKRRRVSRKKDDGEETAESCETPGETNPTPSRESKKIDKTDVSLTTLSSSSAAAAGTPLNKLKTSSKDDETKSWGSKRPKPVDSEVLRYALTTGGELARASQSTDLDVVENDALRAALFKEIAEGEASLAMDKRGSRVLQNLLKTGTKQQVESVVCRLKPYVGELIYDSFASHVVQTMMDVCSAVDGLDEDKEPSSLEQQQLAKEFCDQINKANEWWAMMHDTSASHVARSCVKAMARLEYDEGLEALQKSLISATQSDFRNASRDAHAGPFLTEAISSMPKVADRESLTRRLFSDERNEESFNRKNFDALVADRVSSRVLDQIVSSLSSEFVRDVIFEQGFAAPFLLRSAKHPFANFVVQRTLECLSHDEKVVTRAVEECTVRDMIDFDRVGVLTSLAKATSGCGSLELQTSFCRDLAEAGVMDKATARMAGVKRDAEESNDAAGNAAGVNVPTETNVHLALAETLGVVFANFNSKAKKPLVGRLLQWDISKLLGIAKDPVGGKKLLETLLDSKSEDDEAYALAKRFKGSFVKMVIDRFAIHVAKKAFVLLRKNDRVALMDEEIVPSKTKISGYPTGLKFLTLVKMSEYTSDAKAWAKLSFGAEAKDSAVVDAKAAKKRKLEAELGL